MSAIELVEDAVAMRTNPELVEPSDSQRNVIQERESFCVIINPEAQALFSCRRCVSSWRAYENHFSSGTIQMDARDADCARAASAIVNTAHSLTPFMGPPQNALNRSVPLRCFRSGFRRLKAR